MTNYNPTKPLAELIAMKARIALMQDEFKDVDGHPIDLGYPVQYVAQREDLDDADGLGTVWNVERWGIVTALVKTPQFDYEKREESETEFDLSVKVQAVNVITSRQNGWTRDEFTCEPSSLRVIQ